jgi:multidrug efflux pump subunit AcrB
MMNMKIQCNVISEAYAHGVKKLLFLGSTCIYPKNAPQPMKEDCLLTSPLEYTNEEYAIAKIAGLKMCESYNLQYGTNYIAVMPTNLYGPNDNFHLENSHVMPAMMRKVYLAKLIHDDAWDKIVIDLNKRPVEGVTGNDVTKEVYNQLQSVRDNLPGDLAIEIGGSLEDSKKTLRYLLKPVPIMILLMTILLMLELQDVRKHFIIICTVPLGIIGVVWGLLFFNSSMGMMAQIGTLALGGIIIRNSVVLIDKIKQHLEAGMSPIEAITESAIVRFRPIMLAAFTTVLGLIPLFFSDFWNSMAVTIAAGLTGATLLTLVVLPVLYAIIFKIKN